MGNIVIFGAGRVGKRVLDIYGAENVYGFCDNNPDKIGASCCNKPIFSFEQLKNLVEGKNDVTVIIAAQESVVPYIKKQCEEGLKNCRLEVYKRERMVSFCPGDAAQEDIILYHVLKNIPEVFYIDVGANDPWEGSVTKFLYSFKNAHGINIEPIPEMSDLLNQDRPRDLTICAGAGAMRGKKPLLLRSGWSTFLDDKLNNLPNGGGLNETILCNIVTLKEICDQYINQEIHLLKIDVEGFEEQVLLGADFIHYRPWIICIEAYYKDKTSYQQWEEIILRNQYHFIMMHGVNRYYVADERNELDNRFLNMEQLEQVYDITYIQ